MKKRPDWIRDVDECSNKLNTLLDEFNCELYLYKDLGICVVDKDNKQMELMVPLDKLDGV